MRMRLSRGRRVARNLIDVPAGQFAIDVTDVTTGALLCRLGGGHTQYIRGGQELSDGRFLTWSDDGTLRVWELNHGTCQAVLVGIVAASGVWLSLKMGTWFPGAKMAHSGFGSLPTVA